MRILSRLLLAVAYVLIVTPIALLRRALGGNPLTHRVGDQGYWLRHDRAGEDMTMGRPT